MFLHWGALKEWERYSGKHAVKGQLNTWDSGTHTHTHTHTQVEYSMPSTAVL